ncbi:MAG: ComF family protein [Hydrogenophaga sp.]
MTRTDATALSGCVAAIDYTYPWDGLIARWKFAGETGWSSEWARLMWRVPAMSLLWHSCTRVVPVPVGSARLAQRGFNQAWELVKALQQHAPGHRPVGLSQALVRVRETADQHALPRAQRLINLRDAFAPDPRHRQAVLAQHVLLVDDVSTTGATLQAAARSLLDGGAARVSALVLARTPP